MIVLATLLLVSGLLFAFAFGTVGLVLGALVWVAAGFAFWNVRSRNAEAHDAEPHARPEPRPGWQLFLIIVASVVVSLAGLFALVWKLTEGLAVTGTGFFEAVKAGDMNKAHTYLSTAFRGATTDEQLVVFLKNSRLDQYESSSWTSRNFNGAQGTISGTVKTADGSELSLTMTLVREGGGWKILGINRPDSGLKADAQREQPTLAEQQRIVSETTRQFVAAIEARDFTEFHSQVSAAFKGEADAKRLTDAFASVINADIDLQPVTKVAPEIKSTGFSDNGFFGIEGSYPLDAKRYYFRYDFVQEADGWKLIGINVQIR